MVFPLLLLSAMGCSDEFNPKTDFREELVVFCVLNTSDSVHFVRLETTYDAELGNISGYSGRRVESAKVEIREGSNLYTFRDTLVRLADGSMKKVWYHPNLRPKANKKYTLKVESEGFPVATSVATVPSTAMVDFKIWQTRLAIDSLMVLSRALYYVVEPKGYMYKLDLVYRDTVDGQYVERRVHVPIGEVPGTKEWSYPGITRETFQIYTKANLLKAVLTFGLDKMKWLNIGAVAYMSNIDTDFYNYYKLVRGFDDPRSVRLDQPDYTNITGARGIFGSINVDSVETDLLRYYRLQ